MSTPCYRILRYSLSDSTHLCSSVSSSSSILFVPFYDPLYEIAHYCDWTSIPLTNNCQTLNSVRTISIMVRL